MVGGGGGRDPPNKLTTKQARDWVKTTHMRPSGGQCLGPTSRGGSRILERGGVGCG